MAHPHYSMTMLHGSLLQQYLHQSIVIHSFLQTRAGVIRAAHDTPTRGDSQDDTEHGRSLARVGGVSGSVSQWEPQDTERFLLITPDFNIIQYSYINYMQIFSLMLDVMYRRYRNEGIGGSWTHIVQYIPMKWTLEKFSGGSVPIGCTLALRHSSF